MNLKNIFTVIALVVLALAVFLYITGKNNKNINEESFEQPEQIESEAIEPQNEADNNAEIQEIEEEQEKIEEELGIGEVGESEDSEINAKTPESMFSTTGKILEISRDKLLVTGDGTNFADQKSRNITGILSENTLVVTRTPLKSYKGEEGMALLHNGLEVLLISEENIRGKTEFTLKAIKFLK